MSLASLRCFEYGCAACTPRMTIHFDGRTPERDIRSTSTCVTDDVKKRGTVPDPGFESEPHSPKSDESGNKIDMSHDEVGQTDTVFEDRGENTC